MSILLIYCLVGAVIGLLSGLLGIGGGLVAVPALSWILTLQGVNEELIMHIAVATSLSTIIFTSLASIRVFNRQGEVIWQLVKKLLPGVVIGTMLGIIISQFLSTHDLRIIFGLFVLIISFRLLFEKPKSLPPVSNTEPQTNPRPKHRWDPHGIALTTGLSSGLLGVGGSIIIIPYLLHQGFNIRQASGTSITCSLPIALVGVIFFIATSWNLNDLPPYSTGYINWGATLGLSIPSIFSVSLGGWIGKRVPQTTLRKIFAIFLIFVSLDMLLHQ